MKTLEQLGFVEERNGDRVLFRRQHIFGNYYQWIAFHLKYKEFDLTNIEFIDMPLLEAIYNKAKELFNR